MREQLTVKEAEFRRAEKTVMQEQQRVLEMKQQVSFLIIIISSFTVHNAIYKIGCLMSKLAIHFGYPLCRRLRECRPRKRSWLIHSSN